MYKMLESTDKETLCKELSTLSKSHTIVNIYFSTALGNGIFYSALVEIKDENGSGRKTTRSRVSKKSN